MTEFEIANEIVDDFIKGNDVLIIGSKSKYVTDAREIIFGYLIKNFSKKDLSQTLEEIKTQNELGA